MLSRTHMATVGVKGLMLFSVMVYNDITTVCPAHQTPTQVTLAFQWSYFQGEINAIFVSATFQKSNVVSGCRFQVSLQHAF